jgi:hypothetical protein
MEPAKHMPRKSSNKTSNEKARFSDGISGAMDILPNKKDQANSMC